MDRINNLQQSIISTNNIIKESKESLNYRIQQLKKRGKTDADILIDSLCNSKKDFILYNEKHLEKLNKEFNYYTNKEVTK